MPRRRFLALIERRAAGEPVAYILGRKGFWTLELIVSPAVLVPRPETELLVERALALPAAADATVADLGTGSGAIALALASARPRWRVVATDLSAAALAVARANARALGLERVAMVQGDWLEGLGSRHFDLLLSNPPYVAADDPALESAGADARAAAGAGGGGRRPRGPAPDHRGRACPPASPAAGCCSSMAPAQAAAVAGALVARGFAQVRSQRDLAGRERMTEGQWPIHR